MGQRPFISITAAISFTLLLITTLTISSPEFIKAHSRDSHKNHDNNSHDSNEDRLDAGKVGNQNINCTGSFVNCRNEITNIVCSQVTYCIIGEMRPFLMANPTSQ